MADQKTTDLPEGTDTVIEGAAETAPLSEQEIVVPTPDRTGSSETGLADRFREGRERLAGQAGERARGFVSQGLERTSEALANVARMVGDTAPGIDDRLGQEYGDYARRAAGTIENVANTIAEKDPDELIDDTRNFVRDSPGISLAAAAVVGFVVARVLKAGFSRDDDGDDED